MEQNHGENEKFYFLRPMGYAPNICPGILALCVLIGSHGLLNYSMALTLSHCTATFPMTENSLASPLSLSQALS